MRPVRRGVGATLTAVALAAVTALAAPPAAAVPLPDTSANGEWWFNAFQVPKIWALGAHGQGVTVAVLDTGINAGRPELAGRVLPGTDLIGGGDGRRDLDRPRGHGTAMALFVAGQGGPSGLVGVAPQARVLPVRIAGDTGDSVRLQADGMRWAVDHGAKIVNLSITATGECPAEVQEAVRYAVGKGAVVVAGAGNEGAASNPRSYPGDCAGVLAVGAVDAYRHIWPRSQRQPYVDVAAPGVNMASINLAGQAGKSNGTSDAAALTSAAIALIWSKLPRLTNRQVVARLLATVRDDADRPGRDDATGMGIVRPYNAITAAIPATAANPVFDELDRLPGAAPGGSAPTAPTATGGGSGGGTAGGGAPGTSTGQARSSERAGLSRSTVLLAGAGLVAVGLVTLIGVLVLLGSRRRRVAAAPPAWPPPPPGPQYHR